MEIIINKNRLLTNTIYRNIVTQDSPRQHPRPSRREDPRQHPRQCPDNVQDRVQDNMNIGTTFRTTLIYLGHLVRYFLAISDLSMLIITKLSI